MDYFVKNKGVYGLVFHKPFLDIGLPKDYKTGQLFLKMQQCMYKETLKKYKNSIKLKMNS